MMVTWSKSITSFYVINDQKYYNYSYLLKIQNGCAGGTGIPTAAALMSVAQLHLAVHQGRFFHGGGGGGD